MSRIIDADALMKDIRDSLNQMTDIGIAVDGNWLWAKLNDAIDNAQTIESEQQWIPCSERLPDMYDEVLVTARGEVSIAWLYVDGKWRSNDMPQPMFKDIIAWMPLPEPYKGEQE